MRNVRDVMTSRFRAIHQDQLVCEVAGILDSEKISGAPLVDDAGRLVGVVSKSDIVHFEFLGGDPYVTKVHEIGRSRVKTIEMDAPLQEAALRMLEDQLHRLIVVEEGDPVGIISSFDFVRLVAAAGDVQ